MWVNDVAFTFLIAALILFLRLVVQKLVVSWSCGQVQSPNDVVIQKI